MTVVLKAEVKQLFLDRERVVRAVDRGKRRAMLRVGGAVRLTAKRSMRKRKRSSRPGEPPSSHSGELRGGIFFSYEPRKETVVIGPVGFKGSKVPQVLEFGGRTKIVRNRGEPDQRTERVKIKARPYMGPAEEVNRARLPEAFREIAR